MNPRNPGTSEWPSHDLDEAGKLSDLGQGTPDILSPEQWPTAGWFTAGAQRPPLRGYREYLSHQLRTRYVELEGDFRTVYGNFRHHSAMDHATAEGVANLLHTCRATLESDTPDLLAASSLLDLIERYMVWLYPQHVADARITAIRLRVEALREPQRSLYRKQINALRDHAGSSPRGMGLQRSVYDEIISAYNQAVLTTHIGRGLQIERLKALCLGSAILLAVFLVAFPLLMPQIEEAGGPIELINAQSWSVFYRMWIQGLSIGMMGAMGAFLSGLLQVRGQSQIALPLYQESMLKLQLRPLVGANLALILYVFLVWKVVAGVEITNAGSYLLVAFVSGFSERYFLRLLSLSNDQSPSKTSDHLVTGEQPVLKVEADQAPPSDAKGDLRFPNDDK